MCWLNLPDYSLVANRIICGWPDLRSQTITPRASRSNLTVVWYQLIDPLNIAPFFLLGMLGRDTISHSFSAVSYVEI